MYNIQVQKNQETRISNSGSFLQTPFWQEFKACHGWKTQSFSFLIRKENNEELGWEAYKNTVECSVLIRSFAKGIFSLAYIPMFPVFPKEFTGREEELGIEFANLIQEIAFSLKKYLPKNTICIRFDPDCSFSTPEARDHFNYGINLIAFADRLKIKKNQVDIQPPDTTQIDLTVSEDEILNRMKPKWRYNIRLAEKKGVVVEKITGEALNLNSALDVFYELYKITAERDGIAIHSKNYYEDLLLKSAKELADGKDVPKVCLYIAKHEEDNLGAIISLFSKTESIYLYGCSSNVKRNLMPNFLLQWTSMKDAKTYGSLYYDMYGMPPTADENHPMHGLYLFKTGFGGNNVHRIGSYDVQLKAVYGFFNFAERLRAFWHKKVMKKIRGR